MTYRYSSIYFDEPIVTGRALDVLLPETILQPVALFFIHGGGWTGGSRGNLHKVCRAFNGEGYICGTTDYRLSGVTIEEQIADVVEGYRLFLEELSALGRPPRVAVFGSSAGAHLTLMLGMRGAKEAGLPLPVGLMAQATPTRFEPWEEILPSIWGAMQKIVGVPYATHPEAYRRVAPVELMSAETPPILLMEAQHENMFPTEFNVAFMEQLRALGRRAEMITYPKVEHGFFYDLVRPCQKTAFADMCTFMQSLG